MSGVADVILESFDRLKLVVGKVKASNKGQGAVGMGEW